MSGSHQNPDALERLIDSALRDLGQRRAPQTLESRVLAEIARRAALPWWRKGFAQWPLAARLAFFIASIGIVELAFVAARWMLATVTATRAMTAVSTWLHGVQHLTFSMIDLGLSLISLIPPLWIYAGLFLCVLLYGALFGLGAVGYSVLYASSATRGFSQK